MWTATLHLQCLGSKPSELQHIESQNLDFVHPNAQVLFPKLPSDPALPPPPQLLEMLPRACPCFERDRVLALGVSWFWGIRGLGA